MAKVEKIIAPFYLDMRIDTEGLSNVPTDLQDGELFINVAMNAIIQVGKASKGLPMPEQRKFKTLRTRLQEAVAVKEVHKVELEAEEYRFLMKYWNQHSPDPQANELVSRIDKILNAAQSLHDRNEGKEDSIKK